MDGASAPGTDEDVRLEVYRSFAATGVQPEISELAGRTGLSEESATAALRRLASARHVVLDDAGRILMAHPFAAIPLGFAVMGERTMWWGGCAWDSFALPHLVPDEPEVLVSTRCPACGTAHAWVVGRSGPPPGSQVAHFLVPVTRIWDDVVFSCGHQRLFCAESCVDTWLERTSNPKGYVMDLPTLWRFASRWYEGRLDAGYVRREPSAAADYFRSVGLHGDFWGL